MRQACFLVCRGLSAVSRVARVVKRVKDGEQRREKYKFAYTIVITYRYAKGGRASSASPFGIWKTEMRKQEKRTKMLKCSKRSG